MTRFRVVDPTDAETHESFGDLADITIQATDAASPELSIGTELAVPEAFDPGTLFGVSIDEITAITLDGRTWLPGFVAAVELIVGSGKRVDFELARTNKPKTVTGEMQVVRVHVSRIFAVATGLKPTRGVEDDPTPMQWEERG